MGAFSTMKKENGKVTCETAEGTVINININQRSALDCMLDAIKASRMKTLSTEDEPAMDKPARETGSALTLGLGVSFISVGFLCVVLAVILAAARPWLMMFYTGTHFWVGFPFIVSGVLNIVAYRYPKPFWVVATFISLMACLAVSIAGLVFAVEDIEEFSFSNYQCDALARSLQNQDNYYDGFDRPNPLTYFDNNDNNYDLNNCNRTLTEYKTMLFGLVIMSLLIMVWGICASAITLGYRLKAVLTACKCEKQEEEDKDGPMLSPNAPNQIII